MSFYGKIINYVTNAFNSVKSAKQISSDEGNEIEYEITSESSTIDGNSIIFEGDDSLEPTVIPVTSDIVVQYKHKEKAPDSEVEKPSNTLGFEQPAIDNYGHLNGSTTFVPVLSFLDDGNGNITISGGGNS